MNPDGCYVHYVDQVVTAGTLEKPKVELRNTKLQYPVNTSAKWAVEQALADSNAVERDDIGELYPWLNEIGKTIPVCWTVYLSESDRLAQSGKPYKNVSAIVDLDKAGPEPDGLQLPPITNKEQFRNWVNGPLLVHTGLDIEKLKVAANEAFGQADEDWTEAAIVLFDKFK